MESTRTVRSSVELLESRIAPATFTVTTLLDNGSAGTLRDAINKANAADGADTIVFKAGLTGTITLGSTIGISDALTIKGPGASKLLISGNDTARIFFIDDTDAAKLSKVSISGLGLIDGAGVNGGAIYSVEPLGLTKVLVGSTTVTGSGGGIYVDTPGKVSIASSQFVGNSAPTQGGGLFVRADLGIAIAKTIITGNSAANSFGGGAYLETSAGGKLTLDSVSVQNNGAAGPGAGLSIVLESGVVGTIKNSVIAGNISANAAGGAYLLHGLVSITGTVFVNNSAKTGGGGLLTEAVDSLTLSSDIFTNNVANNGSGAGNGGAFRVSGATGPVNIVGSVFTNNDAAKFGGAISFETSGSLIVKTSSFVGNTGYGGGALYGAAGPKITVVGGLFSDNSALNGASGGGAVYVNGDLAASTSFSDTGTVFTRNDTAGSGGAVFLYKLTATVKSAKFINNSAIKLGGGLDFESGDDETLTVSGGLFRGNTAQIAGGLSSKGTTTTGGTVNIISTSFTDNTASFSAGSGGAIINAAGGGAAGTMTLTKVKITNNSAAQGGGVYNQGILSVSPDSIITDNFAISDPDIFTP